MTEQEIREQIAKEIETACIEYCLSDIDIDRHGICWYHRDCAFIARRNNG